MLIYKLFHTRKVNGGVWLNAVPTEPPLLKGGVFCNAKLGGIQLNSLRKAIGVPSRHALQ